MAAKTFYLQNGHATGVHQFLSEDDPGSNVTLVPAYGWTVATLTPTKYSSADMQTERAAGTFAASPAQPDGSIVTTTGAGDCWRTNVPLTGTFAAGDWTLTGSVIAVSLAGGQDGRVGFRIFRDTSENGSTATEITGSIQQGSVVTDLNTTTQQDSTATVTLSEFSVSDEYIFIQIGWEITGAATGMGTTFDVNFRKGTTASKVVTTNFTQTAGQTESTEATSGSSVSDDPSDIPWTSPTLAGKMYNDNAQYYSTASVIDEKSESLYIDTFGFAIPSGSTIDGIIVEFERVASHASALQDYDVQLLIGGTGTGDDKSAAAYWGTSWSVVSFGGSSDTWSAGATASDVNASSFGVRLKIWNKLGSGEYGFVRQVRMVIYYTPPTGVPGMIAQTRVIPTK